jgi:membrane fusion protein (multidrug efflux system)
MSETPAETPNAERSNFRRWLVVAVVIVLAIGAFSYWRYSQNWESTDDAQIEGRIHEISARVSGTIVKIYVEDNQHVEEATLLAEIDPAGYQAAVDQAAAAVAEAEADAAAALSQVPVVSTSTRTQLSGAEASVGEVQTAIATAEQQAQAVRASLAVAEAQVRQAQANQERAAGDLERYRPLAAKEEISRQQFDAAQSEATAAKAQLDAAEAQLQEVRHAIEVADRQVAQQKARLASAESDVRSAASGPQQVAAAKARAQAAAARVQTEQARLAQAEIDLGHTKIYAPVAGVVRRNIEVGQGVQQGQLTFAIVPLNDIWVLAHFKENQLANIRPGQPAEVSVDAYGGKKYDAHVESISPATGARFSLLPPENATGNYVKVVQRVPVKIVFEEGQGAEDVLRPGMSVVPRIRVQ